MDILNFISWIKGKRVVTTIDPAKTLLPLGLKDGRRDDEYLAGAITVEDFAASIVTPPAYKVYTALLTQTGTDAPVATVLENTIGNIIWSYDSEGIYKAESIGNFTESKTVVFISSGSNYSNFPSFYPTVYPGNNDYFYITTAAIENPPNYNTNSSLLMTPIEIRVYN
jgi:hypothetical protein